MRVIAGIAKRKQLLVPNREDIRPTTDKIKEAIFSALQFELNGKVFLDLFAGSGQMGAEAISRGASRAIFIENNREALRVTNKNIEICGFKEKSIVLFLNAFDFLNNKCLPFDIAFLDPPYSSGILKEILPIVSQKIKQNGVIICETARETTVPQTINNFTKNKIYHYGKISVHVFRNII